MPSTRRTRLLHAAVQIATEAHRGQNRKYTDVPYISHPLSVMMRVRAVSDDESMLAAAILHDVLEDGPDPERSEIDILNNCGSDVLGLVHELTDHYTAARYPDLDRAKRKAAEHRAWQDKSSRAKTIKLADLIDNTEHTDRLDAAFAAVYIREKRAQLNALSGGDKSLHRQAERILDSLP